MDSHDGFLDRVVEAVRSHTGVTGKRFISSASQFVVAGDPASGPGDDGAIIDVDGRLIVACGEAIAPAFVKTDPYGAGIAAVLANVNDVAAMGGVPRGIVNTVVGSSEVVEELLRGIRDAAAWYDVPVIGGHATESTDTTALSAFAVGQVGKVLSMANVRPGQSLMFACCLDGEMRPDFSFFTTLARQAPKLASDIRLLAEVASRGHAVAAKDVSMAGSLGSLAMLLEYTRFGAVLDMRKHPAPKGADPLRWLVSFPTYAFWLATESHAAESCALHFEKHGLICAEVGEVTEDSAIVLMDGAERRTLLDLGRESVTGLWG